MEYQATRSPGQNKAPPTEQESQQGAGLNKEFLKTVPALLKIIEMILVLSAFVCAVLSWYWSGGYFVRFITISAFITTLLFFLFHLFQLNRTFNAPWIIIELIHYIAYCVLLLIAGIISAASIRLYYWNGEIIATMVMTFVAWVVFTLDAVIKYRAWRSAGYSTGQTTPTGNAGGSSFVFCI